jgi:hypothetical protein
VATRITDLIGPTARQLGRRVCICKDPHICQYTKPSFADAEDPSCDPWVYEAIIVSWLPRPPASTLLTRVFELDMKDRPASGLVRSQFRTSQDI